MPTVNRGKRFPPRVLSAIRNGLLIRIRAGMEPHKFLSIWAVVVDGRVFVRSWSIKRRSWYRTFLKDPRGALEIDGRKIPIRARSASSERLRSAVDRAYLEKYNTPGWSKYARDLCRARSRATTTELLPDRRSSKEI